MAGNSQNQCLKLNHEIAGITNSEITNCGDPLYYCLLLFALLLLLLLLGSTCKKQHQGKKGNILYRYTVLCHWGEIIKILFLYTFCSVEAKARTRLKIHASLSGPIFLYDYGVILSTFGLRLKFLNFCLHNKKL